MNYKKFCVIFLTLFIVIFSLTGILNYYFDFYAVFNQNKEVYYGGINDRYAKVAYIIDNEYKYEYETFLWGSSRVQKMDATILGKNSYNMAATAGMPEDCLRDLKLFLNNSIKIKKLYLGIDNFSYMKEHNRQLKHIDCVPYSSEEKENIQYLMKILFNRIENIDIEKIKLYTGLNQETTMEEYGVSAKNDIRYGKYIVAQDVENKITKSVEEYVYDKKFKKLAYVNRGQEHINYTISIIEEIKRLCDDNNIKFIVFFNPVHITAYLEDDINISNQFKRELVKITDFYDFNYINFVMLNNYFWYETSHPRYFVCDWELKVITNQYDKNIPEDFGHLITKENIDYYCNKYIIDRENFKKPSKQYIPEEPII